MVGCVILLSVVLPILVLSGESAGAWNGGAPFMESGRAILNSLLICSVGATLIVAIGLLLGYGVARMREKGRGFPRV